MQWKTLFEFDFRLPPDATRVCVYAGPGTCGLRHTIATFVEAGCHLRLLGPAEVIEGSWMKG